MDNRELQKFIKTTIEDWVGRNYGSQERHDPSWDIKALARCISKELGGKIPLEKRKPYELTVIFHPEADLEDAIKGVERAITDNGGRITNKDFVGRKRIAYPINGQDFGNYMYFDIEIAENGAPAKVSSTLNINDNVLRYLMVRKDF